MPGVTKLKSCSSWGRRSALSGGRSSPKVSCSVGWGPYLAFAALWAGQALLLGWLGTDFAGAFGAGTARFLGVREIFILLLGGLAVGAASGAVASRAAR